MYIGGDEPQNDCAWYILRDDTVKRIKTSLSVSPSTTSTSTSTSSSLSSPSPSFLILLLLLLLLVELLSFWFIDIVYSWFDLLVGMVDVYFILVWSPDVCGI